MNESFLYYLWKFRLYNSSQLQTEDGETIEVIHPGQQNTDAGPDFFNAKIKIGKTVWAGNVEIHVKADDWQKHGHVNNRAFDNTILHVVHEGSHQIKRADNTLIPVLQLKNQYDSQRWNQYEQFISSKSWTPCANQIHTVDALTIQQTIDRMLTERLERKVKKIEILLQQNKGSWEESFYLQLARNFGFKTNADPFELLARSLPLSILAKHKNNLFQIEALVFGQSGLLNENNKDEYATKLFKEYSFLKTKFNLKNLEGHLWKFARMHPPGFPTIRLAQFAELVYQSSHLFSKVLETKNYKDLQKLFDVDTSEYWQTHFVFDKQTKPVEKSLGTSSIENILINTLAPFLFFYGKQKNEPHQVDKAFEWLEQCLPENNVTIRGWKELNIKANSAYQSQALIQLKNEYCNAKKCLTCTIGLKLLQTK